MGEVGEAGGGERDDGFLSSVGAAGPGFQCCGGGGLGTEEYIGDSEDLSIRARYTSSRQYSERVRTWDDQGRRIVPGRLVAELRWDVSEMGVGDLEIPELHGTRYHF